MSYEDGDVSMASFRDESFNMSVDEEGIDIVWHSTQSPAIRTILEESKLHQRQGSPMAWEQNETSSIFGSGVPAPKSLFKTSSTSQIEPVTSFTTPDPAALRRMRPSQRRAYTQIAATTQRGESGSPGGDTSDVTNSSSTEKLESLREMINSVGQSWSRERQISHPGRIEQVSTSTTKSTSNVSFSTPSSSTSQAKPEATKPKVATIKSSRPLQDQWTKPPPRSQNLVMKGQMLPPAVPLHRKADSSDMNLDEDRVVSPISMLASDIKETSLMDNNSTDNAEESTHAESPSALGNSKRFAASSDLSHGTRSFSHSSAVVSQDRTRPKIQHVETPLLSKPQSKKVLGMRRTPSSSQTGIGATSSQLSTTIPIKAPPSNQPGRSIQRTNSMEYCPTQSKTPLVPTLDTTARPRTFKVPWAGASNPPSRTNSITSTSGSPTVISASQSSGSGSESAQTSSGDSEFGSTAKAIITENPDSSYSFDDLDPEELHRVLSQCGA